MNSIKGQFAIGLLMLTATQLSAQNPVITGQFSADPTARVFEGKVYLFPSHDIPPVPVEGQRQDWFCMGDYHVFSSENLSDWTDHGVILDQKDVPWGDPQGYSMWAPDCIQGKDGKYYFFFPDKPKEGRGFGIGVAIADKPYGPYKAVEKNIEGISGIDPCVLQASDGNAYIFWGAGGLRVAKLKDNLLELAEDNPVNTVKFGEHEMKFVGVDCSKDLPKAGLMEGPFAFERNGKYYLTYPWVRYNKGDKNEKGEVLDNPTEALAYAMSDNPMGPYEYKGIIMKESPTGCWTNHHSIVQYKGQWYLFYHHNDYSPKFDKNRSVRIDSLTFNADGTIQEVIPTLRGVGETDGRSKIQMDRYSTIGGGASVAYNDSIHPFLGWKLVLPEGGYATYSNVRVPASDYKVWVNTLGFFGRSTTQSIDKTKLQLTVTPLSNGLSELKLTNTGKAAVEVDWISLNDRQPLAPLSRGGMETGQYRNLFAEAGYSQAEIDARLQAAWDDVFVNKATKVYFEVEDSLAYISDVKNDDVRTEGMSYGMMLAVQWDKKDVFDRLWRWSKKYMQMQEGPMKGYFRWTCKRTGEANSQGPASDGELYYITSLIFASNRWGNDTGINYLKEAQDILNIIQPHEVEVERRWGPDHKPLEKPIKVKQTISLMDPESKLITFVPGSNFTDPSYHLPAFYEVWARYAEDGRASYWRECARVSREYLHKSMHPATGLNPDNNNYDGTIMQPRGPFPNMGAAFRYDSWRVPMNIALDYSWSCADPVWQHNYGHLLQNFLYKEGVHDFVDQYNVDGTRPERLYRAGHFPEKLRHSIGFVGTAAALSIVCDHPKSYEFIDELWNAKHGPDAEGFFDGYYDGIIRLFAMMHLSGRYQVIEKTMQLSSYFKPVAGEAKPDQEGFIRRWLLLDPINKPNNTNTVFVDSYLRENFGKEYFKGQTLLTTPAKNLKTLSKQYPKNGQKVACADQTLEWHAFDSQIYNNKLYRLATCLDKQRYGVIFWATTIIDAPEEMTDVRLAVGSNSASMWWLNGAEAAILSGDRRMVKDDVVSSRITLHKGVNILTGVIINGPGMSDFCVRFLDSENKPVTNLNIKTTF